MTNRLQNVQFQIRSLSPVEAIVTVSAEAEDNFAGVELRGRLTGPTCPYSSTIEVAYPLRMDASSASPGQLSGRVVIPEPSLWDPVSPFLYHGVVELWREREFCDRAEFRVGLRSFLVSASGVVWNGRRLELRIKSKPHLSPGELPALHRSGYNCLFLDWPSPELVEAAERIGFVILGRLPSSPPAVSNPLALLGYVLPADWRSREDEWRHWTSQCRRPVGAPVDGKPVSIDVQFLISDDPEPQIAIPRIVQAPDNKAQRRE
jgi:hypothetical protein